MLEIRPLVTDSLKSIVGRLSGYDLAVFISRNAVEQGLACVHSSGTWPANLAVAAIGTGTRRALEEEGMTGVVSPDGAPDSAALLAHPSLKDVLGKQIVIFRGVGGREQLASTLRSRGGTVDYAECYTRLRPDSDPQLLLDAWSRQEVDAVTVSSAEGLANLDALVGGRGKSFLRSTPLFVPHPRVAEAARGIGVETVLETGPADADMYRALVAYFGHSG